MFLFVFVFRLPNFILILIPISRGLRMIWFSTLSADMPIVKRTVRAECFSASPLNHFAVASGEAIARAAGAVVIRPAHIYGKDDPVAAHMRKMLPVQA